MDAVKKAVAASNVAPSIRIEYGGAYARQQRSFRDLVFVLVLAVVLVFTVLLFELFMGLILVIGILAKNGILLLDAGQKFRAEDAGPEEALILAGERRLRC